jgi:hypothetical protein
MLQHQAPNQRVADFHGGKLDPLPPVACDLAAQCAVEHAKRIAKSDEKAKPATIKVIPRIARRTPISVCIVTPSTGSHFSPAASASVAKNAEFERFLVPQALRYLPISPS